ncbi:unnamed protein product [Linum trigynum]|uniref:Uncharacterized protein n=1 Tax=Linum trigynum TaxID=586398 RepID=A0AAV2FP53_9ROSI
MEKAAEGAQKTTTVGGTKEVQSKSLTSQGEPPWDGVMVDETDNQALHASFRDLAVIQLRTDDSVKGLQAEAKASKKERTMMMKILMGVHAQQKRIEAFIGLPEDDGEEEAQSVGLDMVRAGPGSTGQPTAAEETSPSSKGTTENSAAEAAALGREPQAPASQAASGPRKQDVLVPPPTT